MKKLSIALLSLFLGATTWAQVPPATEHPLDHLRIGAWGGWGRGIVLDQLREAEPDQLAYPARVQDLWLFGLSLDYRFPHSPWGLYLQGSQSLRPAISQDDRWQYRSYGAGVRHQVWGLELTAGGQRSDILRVAGDGRPALTHDREWALVFGVEKEWRLSPWLGLFAGLRGDLGLTTLWYNCRVISVPGTSIKRTEYCTRYVSRSGFLMLGLRVFPFGKGEQYR